LSTDGLRFSEPGYFEGLLQTGLDHLLVVISVLDPSTLKMLKHISEADIHATIHITIREKNRDEVKGLLEKLAEIGIRAISLTASGPALKGDLQAARGVVAALGMTLIWDVPVPYSSTNPFDLEFEDQERPSGAGRAWLYVEPDGDVLPDQAVDRVLGNLLRDPWEMILTSSMD
jgi:MoaA/NifB/PqqE/SkfB family radical SAM enzyme